MKKLVIFGVGLIGGSVALALKQAGYVTTIVGVGRTRASLDDALKLNVIDHAETDIATAMHGADMVLIDPAELRAAKVGGYAEARFDELGGLLRMVNRNDGVVKTVIINGNIAFENDLPADGLGTAPDFGRFLPRLGHTER